MVWGYPNFRKPPSTSITARRKVKAIHKTSGRCGQCEPCRKHLRTLFGYYGHLRTVKSSQNDDHVWWHLMILTVFYSNVSCMENHRDEDDDDHHHPRRRRRPPPPHHHHQQHGHDGCHDGCHDDDHDAHQADATKRKLAVNHNSQKMTGLLAFC